MEEFPSFCGWVIFQCVCVCAYLLSHLLMDTWIGFISLNNAYMNTGVLVSFWVSVFLLFRYIPRNGIARLHDRSFFSLFRNLNTVSTPATLIYAATNTVWGFPFLHILGDIGYLETFSWQSFWRVWGDIVVLICISRWLTVQSIFPYACWPSVYPWENVWSGLLPIFKLFFFIYIEFMSVLYSLDAKSLLLI